MIPDSPESCSSITNPLFVEISRKRIELIDLMDCIDYTTESVCVELDGTVTDTITDNEQKLADKGAAVIAKLSILRAVSDGSQDAQAFTEGLRGEYLAALADGSFTAVLADFSTPTETFPDACAEYADYTDLTQLINDVSDACSFDAWLQAIITS